MGRRKPPSAVELVSDQRSLVAHLIERLQPPADAPGGPVNLTRRERSLLVDVLMRLLNEALASPAPGGTHRERDQMIALTYHSHGGRHKGKAVQQLWPELPLSHIRKIATDNEKYYRAAVKDAGIEAVREIVKLNALLKSPRE